MINSISNSKLDRFYHFFETYGNERLNGLDESYFIGLNQSEKDEAWNFLKDGVPTSYERIKGLYVLDQARAIPLFKTAVALPMEPSPYASEREQLESSRLLMLSYINSVEPEEKFINAMIAFANSEFPDIRAQFARSLPAKKITPEAIEALKNIILTETETNPRTSAITKFMSVHGMKFKLKDAVYDSIYLSLRSDKLKEKLSAIKRLEAMRQPDYL